MGSENRSENFTGEQMQTKISAARRDAEGLKDKIKRRKDELQDTTRKSSKSRSLLLWYHLCDRGRLCHF